MKTLVYGAGPIGRLAVCPTLAKNKHLKHILFLGNDVSGFERYSNYLPAEFDSLRASVKIDTPNFDELLSYVPGNGSADGREEVTK